MAIVVEVYKDFSDSKEIVFCECGKSVLENFPIETDWKDYKIICNNNFVSPDHIIAETDKLVAEKKSLSEKFHMVFLQPPLPLLLELLPV